MVVTYLTNLNFLKILPRKYHKNALQEIVDIILANLWNK